MRYNPIIKNRARCATRRQVVVKLKEKSLGLCVEEMVLSKEDVLLVLSKKADVEMGVEVVRLNGSQRLNCIINSFF